MNPTILYRRGVDPDADQKELEAAEYHFDVIFQRSHAIDGDLIIGRMSVLPFYKELESDLLNQGAIMINNYRQHQFIADMREWCEVLGDMTPKLYDRLQDLPEEGPFVVKGQTNSKKHLWNTHMFAKNKRQAIEVASELNQDSLIGTQTVYARDYVPLVQLGEGFNGLPITEEYRFFVCKGQILSGGFYWASHVGDVKVPDGGEVPEDFLKAAIAKIGTRATFYALDVARKADGGWMVVEINDGQMSGLSCNDPWILYENLAKAVLL